MLAAKGPKVSYCSKLWSQDLGPSFFSLKEKMNRDVLAPCIYLTETWRNCIVDRFLSKKREPMLLAGFFFNFISLPQRLKFDIRVIRPNRPGSEQNKKTVQTQHISGPKQSLSQNKKTKKEALALSSKERRSKPSSAPSSPTSHPMPPAGVQSPQDSEIDSSTRTSFRDTCKNVDSKSPNNLYSVYFLSFGL